MKNHRSPDALGAGIFLIGLGALFLLPGVGFFPWILVVIGLAGLPVALSGNRGWAAWKGLFWLGGLAVLFASGAIWPGILVLVGLNMLLSALAGSNQEENAEPAFAPQVIATPTAVVTSASSELVRDAPERAEADVVAQEFSGEADEQGTTPLSPEDIDTLEAELAANVEGDAGAVNSVSAGQTAWLDESASSPDETALAEAPEPQH